MISCQPHASWSYCVFISSLDICVYPYRAILSVFIYVYDKIEMFIWYLLLNMLYIHSNFFIKKGWQNYTFHIKWYSANLSAVPVLCQLFWNTIQHFFWTYQWELIDGFSLLVSLTRFMRYFWFSTKDNAALRTHGHQSLFLRQPGLPPVTTK